MPYGIESGRILFVTSVFFGRAKMAFWQWIHLGTLILIFQRWLLVLLLLSNLSTSSLHRKTWLRTHQVRFYLNLVSLLRRDWFPASIRHRTAHRRQFSHLSRFFWGRQIDRQLLRALNNIPCLRPSSLGNSNHQLLRGIMRPMGYGILIIDFKDVCLRSMHGEVFRILCSSIFWTNVILGILMHILPTYGL